MQQEIRDHKIKGLDTYLSPEMKSTGEAIGYDNKLNRALYKALTADPQRTHSVHHQFDVLEETTQTISTIDT